MPNQAVPNAGKTEKLPTQDVHTSETDKDKRIDRIADQAAERAGKREANYDRDNDIFTK